MAGEYVVVYNILPEVAERLDKTLSQIVRKTAFDLAADAARSAPVDTGFLKNSIYVVTDNKSNYEAKAAKAESKNPNGEMLPEVVAPDSHTEAIVAVGASYGLFVEYGSSHGPAQPYLTPAAEFMRPLFMQALSMLEEKLGASLVGGIDEVSEEG